MHFLHISAPKAVLMGYSAVYSEITAHMLLNLSFPLQKRTLPGGDIVRSGLYWALKSALWPPLLLTIIE